MNDQSISISKSTRGKALSNKIKNIIIKSLYYLALVGTIVSPSPSVAKISMQSEINQISKTDYDEWGLSAWDWHNLVEDDLLKKSLTKVSIKEILEASKNNDAKSMVLTAAAYEYGIGVAINKAEAIRWYRASAEAGNASGMFNIGAKYEFGIGINKNEEQAAYWYKRAAEGGSGGGMMAYGTLLEEGRGIARNEAEAIHWYRASAQSGYLIGIVSLGLMLESGIGILERNEAEAAQLYLKGAQLGDANSMVNIGLMLAEGRGVPKNDAQAKYWWLQAVKFDDSVFAFLASGYLKEFYGIKCIINGNKINCPN